MTDRLKERERLTQAFCDMLVGKDYYVAVSALTEVIVGLLMELPKDDRSEALTILVGDIENSFLQADNAGRFTRHSAHL